MAPSSRPRIVAVIGRGFSGTLFALKLSAARTDCRVFLIEPHRAARGVAYGAATQLHILNVPVSRMEVGLQPSFTDWLELRKELLAEALAEAGGRLSDAFVPRRLFGDYLAEQLHQGLSRPNLTLVEGEAVSLAEKPRAVVLANGASLPPIRWCWRWATCHRRHRFGRRHGWSPIPGRQTHWTASRPMRACC